MGETTEIAWTDATFNPWWGCVRVSPGCERCYAETFAKRVGLSVWGVQAERRVFGDKHWNEPLKWHRDAAKAGVRRRVFCASMADVFEDRPNPKPGYHYVDVLSEQRARLWEVIHKTPWLDWQLLTKRPENADRLAIRAFGDAFGYATHDDVPADPWMPNVLLGATVEDRKRAETRIPLLRAVPAARRFLSVEPLLEDLGPLDLTGIHWVIVGGESGGKARPFALEWARNVVAQCRAQSVPVFVKQMGAAPIDGSLVDVFGPRGERHYTRPAGNAIEREVAATPGYHVAAHRLRLRDAKGGDMAEWPEDLRVREFPEAAS